MSWESDPIHDLEALAKLAGEPFTKLARFLKCGWRGYSGEEQEKECGATAKLFVMHCGGCWSYCAKHFMCALSAWTVAEYIVFLGFIDEQDMKELDSNTGIAPGYWRHWRRLRDFCRAVEILLDSAHKQGAAP